MCRGNFFGLFALIFSLFIFFIIRLFWITRYTPIQICRVKWKTVIITLLLFTKLLIMKCLIPHEWCPKHNLHYPLHFRNQRINLFFYVNCLWYFLQEKNANSNTLWETLQKLHIINVIGESYLNLNYNLWKNLY